MLRVTKFSLKCRCYIGYFVLQHLPPSKHVKKQIYLFKYLFIFVYSSKLSDEGYVGLAQPSKQTCADIDCYYRLLPRLFSFTLPS